MDEKKLKSIAAQLRHPQGEDAVRVGEKMNQVNLHINRYSIEALKLAEGDNVLEIGMGNGFFVKDILSIDDSIKYTGCDFSEIMVAEAISRNQTFIRSGQAQFHLTGAEKLPFENETFDKVFSVNTIYFWDDLQSALSEIWRVLKPEGQIVISIRPKSVMQNLAFVKYGFAIFTKEELTNLLSGRSFRVIRILEKAEPALEIDGEQMNTETLLIAAQKIKDPPVRK